MKKSGYIAALVALLLTATVLFSGCDILFDDEDDYEAWSPSKNHADASDSYDPVEDMDDYVRLHAEMERIYDGQYRSQLLAAEKVIYDGLVHHIIEQRRTDDLEIDFSSVEQYVDPDYVIDEIILCAFWIFVEDYPEAGGVTYDSGYVETSDENRLETVSISFGENYDNAFDDLDEIMENVEDAVDEIKNSRKSGSRYDTLLAIHDYICLNSTYDDEAAEDDYNPYVEISGIAAPLFGGGTRGRQFVCAGYSLSFKLLCNRFDIPCYDVGGECPEGAHAWNFVQMEDGNWYGVDLTWDDEDDKHLIYDFFLCGKNTVIDGAAFGKEHVPDPGPYFTYLSPDDESDEYYPVWFPKQADEKYRAA